MDLERAGGADYFLVTNKSIAADLVVVPLDDLDEDGGPVLHWLGEDLQQVAVVVIVDQDLELLDRVNVFLHLVENEF